MSERDLHRTIGESINEAIAGLRREFEERLEAYRNTLEEHLAAAFAEPAEPAEEASTTGDLLTAFQAIESGSSQSEILQALLRHAAAYAGRLAFLLTPDGEYLLWDTSGFEPPSSSPAAESFSAPAYGPWRDALAGRGHVELSATDCALLCDRLGGQPAEGGVLIPFILQGRLAAFLYADRSHESSLDVPGLSVLTWAAARAIETLPFRERPAVAMLRPAADAAMDEPETPLWAPPAEAEVEEEARADEVEATQEAEAVTDELLEPAAPAEAESEIETETITLEGEEEPSAPDEDTEPLRPAWSATAEVLEQEEIAEEVAEEVLEEDTEPTPEMTATEIAEPAEPVDTEPVEAEFVASPDEVETEVFEPPETVETQTEIQTAPEAAAGDQETESSAPREPSSEFEVMPPSDISGPGWAFTTNADDGDDEEAFHAEAKRLARLLVSEIKLYHEVDVWEGRRKGNVYGELQDEIDRSRQLFDERVDEEIRSKRDYFYEELVRQLADGNADVLGI